MSQKDATSFVILSASDANGAGTSARVSRYRHLKPYIVAANSANLTIKCQVGYGEEEPDFSSAASATNRWHVAQMKDKDDDASVAGSTGISFNGSADGANGYVINDDHVDWVNFIVSSYVAGDVSVELFCSDNQ